MSKPVAAHAIVGFAFGQGPPRTSSTRRRRTSSRTRPTPGGTNRGLAWSVAALLRKYRTLGLPRPTLCLQQEIADALGTDVVDPATDHFIPSQPADGAYVDTAAVARHAVGRGRGGCFWRTRRMGDGETVYHKQWDYPLYLLCRIVIKMIH